tara:strand:+ start:568 stop:792 length:225 start_codon:yes stop_codon:yes gene_type:complete
MEPNVKKLLWFAYDLASSGESKSNIYMMGVFIAIVFARNLGLSKDAVYGELLRQWMEVDKQLGETTVGGDAIDE